MVKAGKKVIFVLGGALVNDAGTWRTTNYDEGDNFGISGDRLRVLAAAYLYRDNNDASIIVLGGRGQLKNISGSPPVAKVIKRELIDLGVPAGKIAIETKSGNTYEQLKALINVLKKIKIKEISIISNQHHFKRIKAMLATAPGLENLKSATIKFISAEAVTIKYGEKKWKKIIDRAYASQTMKERIALEKKGVKQIRAGTYNFK